MSKLSVPCHWDESVLEEILGINMSKGIEIGEIYGTISDGPCLHCRGKETVCKVDREYALDFKKKIDKYKLKFAYVLNSPIVNAEKQDIVNEIWWIINEFKATSITVASFELMKIIRENFPAFPINISTVAGVLSIKDIEKYIELKPERIILHHDCNRNYKELDEMIKYGKQNAINIEIMLNESCLRRCSRRSEHYCSFSTGESDHKFHLWCNSRKITYPYELLLANFIRPEDVKFYEQLGIETFKVTGRSKPSKWLYETVEAYLKRDYDKNLIRLLGIDPKLNSENLIYISNKALDGFIDNFPKCGSYHKENMYCNEIIKRLYKNGDFTINKNGAKVFENDGILQCKTNTNIYSLEN